MGRSRCDLLVVGAFLYPIIEEQRGQAYAAKLYHEHSEILATIQQLKESEQAHPQQIATWIEGMQEGLRQAAVCGTLLSHVVTLPEAQQEKLLNELESLRKLGRRWSELHPDEV